MTSNKRPYLPTPGAVDYCADCEQDKPLYLLEGADGDHTHACADCLRRALARPRVAINVKGITAEDVRAAFARMSGRGTSRN